MGAGCCRCYKVPTTDETKVQQTISSSDKSVPPQPINAVNSVSVSTSPIPSNTNGQQNGKTLQQKQPINGTNHHHDEVEIDEKLKQRLIDFYKIHNPSKLNNHAAIHEICKRYKGREEKLFSDLNNKYSQKNIENDDKTPTEDQEDTPQAQEDENSPLTAKPIKTPTDKPKIKLPLDAKATNNKKAASPQSTSKRKPSKHLLGSESPPDSGSDYDDEQDIVNSHPIMMDMDVESESTPIVTHKKMVIDIDEHNHHKKDKIENNKKEQTNEKLANLPFPAFKKESFKIEVTKPMKKKPLGTNLFGTPSASSRKRDDFGKPLFKNNSSNSFSNSRSTSFIGTPFDSNGQVPSLSVARSHTLTLDSSHKSSLDKRRQSSLAVRRNQNRRNLPIRINKVWAVFAQYIIDKMLEEKQMENANENGKEKENKKKKSKKTDENLNDIEEDFEATPEPEEAVIDSILSHNNDPPSKRKKGHESMEVLDIDPRLFADAKGKSRRSASSNRSSTSSNKTSSDEEDESSDGGLNIDVYEIEITYPQFNIVLNNANIAVSPDMSAALIWLLLDINNMLDEVVKNLGLESDNLHNNPMKERGFHQKQFKKIYKCKISYKMIDTLMKHLNNGSIGRQDKTLHPKHLSYNKRNLVIWDKIFEHLINKTSFNIEEEYLYGALQEDELRDGDKIISMLSSLESHWQHRVQLMEHIDDKLNSGSDMERDIFFASILSNNENFIHVLTGWACQLTDDRSGVARTAVTLLPAVLSSILLCIQYPAILFNENEVIDPIYTGIFTLVKNRRLKDMADDAYESLIQVTDIFAEVASHLQDYQLLSMIIKVLEDHTNPKIEKHDKCRESCIGGMGFLLYGIEPPAVDNPDDIKKKSALLDNPIDEDKAVTPTTPIGALSQKDDDEKMPDIPDHIRGLSLGLQKANGADKTSTKLSKIMQREYLLKNEQFVTSFGNMLKYGVTDKSESGRRKAFKLLQRLENEKEGKLLEELQGSWDFTVQKKYKNWKKLNERKKNSSIKGRNRKNSKQRKSARKSKGKGKSLKNQVKKKKSVENTKKEKDIKFTASKAAENKTNDNDNDNNNDDNTTTSNTRITITSDDADKTNHAD